MKFPSLRRTPRYAVGVPQLSGGLNMSDAPHAVEDNQLTDVHNMWWHEGVLQTRPGLQYTGAIDDYGGQMMCVGGDGERDGIFISADQKLDYTTISGFRYIDGVMTEAGWKHDEEWDTESTCFATAFDRAGQEELYFYTSSGKLLKSVEGVMKEAEPYIPLTMVNGKGEKDTSGSAAVTLEGYNMLTGWFRNSFVADGESQWFTLSQDNLDNTAVEVEIDLYNAASGTIRTETVTFEVGFDGENSTKYIDNISSAEAGDGWTEGTHDSSEYGITMRFWRDTGTLSLYMWHGYMGNGGYENEYRGLPRVPGVNNPIRVKACKNDEQKRQTILSMQRSVWFGGTRSGLGGGTRLFVCGNPDKKNLVHWSDINNPLYFPEDNYAYIGSSTDAVTGFGKQADLLIVFKEHEIYTMQYVDGDYTAQDVMNGTVIDTTVAAAVFPITPLHASIGCDCPGSIRLVNNRLVWATSDAHVYMMPSVNQWSERNVRDITALIRQKLERHTAAELKKAHTAEYAGYYLLYVGRYVYLLDVGNSAFQSYQYYASESKASRALPWYVWELNDTPTAVFTDNEVVRMVTGTSAYVFNKTIRTGIDSWFKTKLFDFGKSNQKKSITKLFMQYKDIAGSEIVVSYITDTGTEEDAQRIVCEGTDMGAGTTQTMLLTPHERMCRLFGMEVHGMGGMAIEGITLEYGVEGGTK